MTGMAFSNVGLGVDHGMAHPLSAFYGIPHGVACATLLPYVMEFNKDYTGEKFREIARVMGVEGVDEMSQEEYRQAAIDAVIQLSKDCGCCISSNWCISRLYNVSHKFFSCRWNSFPRRTHSLFKFRYIDK